MAASSHSARQCFANRAHLDKIDKLPALGVSNLSSISLPQIKEKFLFFVSKIFITFLLLIYTQNKTLLLLLVSQLVVVGAQSADKPTSQKPNGIPLPAGREPLHAPRNRDYMPPLARRLGSAGHAAGHARDDCG